MKKNRILMYFAIAILCLSAVSALADNVQDSAILVQDIKYEPYPAEPGKYLDVWLKIENFGSQNADNFVIELMPEFPFSLDSNEDAIKTFGTVLAHQAILVKYTVRIADNAVEGETGLRFRYQQSLGEKWKDGQANIFIKTSDANIAVNAVNTPRIAQGEAQPVEIELLNTADSPLTDVNVKLDLEGASPFVPINSTAEKKLSTIGPNTKQSVVFNLMALPDAKSGVYKVPIEIRFTDGTGANYTKSNIIGLIVGEEPDLSIIVDKSEIYKTGDVGNVIIKFANKGLSDVKLMNVILKPSPNYDIISSNEIYIGSVASDDYETADFRIQVKKSEKGISKLSLELSYLDSNNQRYDRTVEVPLKIVSADKLGIKQGGSLGLLVTAIFIVVVGYFVYRRWEKKKKQKLAKK